jgi:hypothetical protein
MVAGRGFCFGYEHAGVRREFGREAGSGDAGADHGTS